MVLLNCLTFAQALGLDKLRDVLLRWSRLR